jgi:3-dehydroquinate synthase
MAIQSNGTTTQSVSCTVVIEHSYHFTNDLFKPSNLLLADLYQRWKRCLAIIDYAVHDLYGRQIREYFEANAISATIKRAYIPEDQKTIDMVLKICEWITEFDLVRREPVLLIGGGLVTDVAG